MIHVDFVADKGDDSEITQDELDSILDDIIGVIEAHGLLMGGGAHDCGDPNSVECKQCGEYERRVKAENAQT
jgi:hypothetical protein